MGDVVLLECTAALLSLSTGGVTINITYKLKQIKTGVPLMDDSAKCYEERINYSFVPPARTVPGILTEENQ